jgi:hypothetical protein
LGEWRWSIRDVLVYGGGLSLSDLVRVLAIPCFPLAEKV